VIADAALGASMLTALYGERWLIMPERLTALAQSMQHANAASFAAASSFHAARPAAPKKAGSVLRIPVYGPIVPRASWFSRLLGLTAVDEIAAEFKAGLRDPNAMGIVLDIDSPGGSASGIDALAGMIYAARGRKPIVSYVEGTCASAAYWIASAADEVIVSPGSILGSIGVVAVFARDSGRTVEIVSSQSPNKRPNIETPEGRAVVQTVVDDLAAVFVDDVASHRGMTSSSVIERFGRGGIRVGEHAVAAGMADRVGTLESVIASIRSVALAPVPVDPLSDSALLARWDADPRLHLKYATFPVFALIARDEAKKDAEFRARLAARDAQ